MNEHRLALPTLERSPSRFRKVGQLCGGVAAIGGAAACVGWAASSRWLVSFAASYGPMALDTALAFVLLGVALAALARPRQTRGMAWLVRGAALVVLLYVTLRLCELVMGQDLGTQHWFAPEPPESFQVPGPVQMTFFTAVNFWFAAAVLGLLAVFPARRRAGRSLRFLALTLAVTVVAMSLVFALGYLFGEPFFHGQPAIPMAFNSSLAFLALGGGLLLLMGPEVSPLAHLMGPSVASRLLRAFLPFTVLMVGAVAWLTHLLGGTKEASSAGLITALLAVAAMFLAGFLSERIARVVSANLE